MLTHRLPARSALTGFGRWALPAGAPWLWFVGRDHGGVVTDLAAIVLPLIVVVAAVALGVVGWRWRPAAAGAASLLAVGLVAVVGPLLPREGPPVDDARAVAVLAANIDSWAVPIDALLHGDPDIVVVGELTPDVSRQLAARFPYHNVVLGRPQVGVYSRFPLTVLERPGNGLPGWRLRVEGPGGPFVLYALHVPRPWPRPGYYQVSPAEHRRMVDAIADGVSGEQLPVVVAGDLNLTDRASGYRRLTRELNDGIGGWRRPTSRRWWWLVARIDHLLVDESWCSSGGGYSDLPGGSHLAVSARVGPCRG